MKKCHGININTEDTRVNRLFTIEFRSPGHDISKYELCKINKYNFEILKVSTIWLQRLSLWQKP